MKEENKDEKILQEENEKIKEKEQNSNNTNDNNVKTGNEEKEKTENNDEKNKTEKVEKENDNQKVKKKSKKTRMILVVAFVLIFAFISYIIFRGSYLEYKELGEKFIPIFYTNIKYQAAVMGINFIILYFIIYMTNRGIKKGLKEFFDKENKPMPKLMNKSIALIISLIVSVIIGVLFTNKIILFLSNASFGVQDPIFNLDIAYYMMQKPVIQFFIIYFMLLVIGLSIYMAIYYIVVFNKCFDGIDGKMLKQSNLTKKIRRNVVLLAIGIALYTIVGTQNILFGEMLKIDDDITITGAGSTEATIKLWGYLIFSIILVISIYRATKIFDFKNIKETIKRLAIIPGYLIVLFIVMIGYDVIFVNSNELDKEKEYIEYNIENTKTAYNININEKNISNTGTITQEEIEKNENVINNTTIVSKEALLKTLEDSQTGTGYFQYNNTVISPYEINGKTSLVNVTPRESLNTGRTYNSKTYECTHGIGVIISSATSTTANGTINYIQKSISGDDQVIEISEPRIYFGLETNDNIATNTKNKKEYDYTDETGKEITSTYEGKAGLNLSFFDKLILGITKGDINLASSGEITEESKILINRNIIERAKKALPDLMYDANPYVVITDDGDMKWVLDAYTVSSDYPYSQYTTIEYNNRKQKINYIRNSVKVIIDAYDGTMDFYITDRTDPIAMAYRNTYTTLFEDLDKQIPTDIAKHVIYPEFLYTIQSKMLNIYHNVKPDVLYRSDDIWSIAKANTTNSSKSTGTTMTPYYTMVKDGENKEKLGILQIYTPSEKQNMISYLVGTTNGTTNILNLYKFSEDSSVMGPMQLDKQISADEEISKELESIATTGTKITKQMIIVPLENTLLYVEPVYQTMLNESEVPVLKKIIVASGNKVAIGDNLTKALEKLLSTYAVDIEVENTEDIQGLIEAIIKANKNLTNSNTNNDWEMMGKDVKKLQELINTLEKTKEEEDKKKQELQKSTTTETNINKEKSETETNNVVENVVVNALN